MASTNGNTVSGGSTSSQTAYSWRCIVEIAVASESATQVKYTVRLKYYTRYAIDVYSNGKLSGGASGSWSGSMKSTSNSGKTVTVITKSVTVNKGSSSKSFSVSGQIQNTGGFGNGTSKATCTVTVPAIDYSTPNAPSNCAASRVSDSQAKATWTNGSTSTTRPRSSTKVERQTDSGSWTQIASVGSSTANYTDNGIGSNHRYRYRVRAQGSGGYSGYATSGYIYTTPAAPTSVELVKTSDTQVQVSIQGAAPWADSYKLQRSVDSGAWVDAASVTSWPYVDTPGGGMVRYRVAAVKGSLQSAWTESAEIATITPPLAPSVALSPADAVLPVGTAVTIAWTPDHPDGSAQSSAQVEYTVAGSASTATVTGASTTYALPATALDAPATVSVRVRTKGLDPDWGAWSSPAQLTLAYPPSVSITTPGIDGATVSELPLISRWSVDDSTGVAEQTLRLYEDGALVHTAQLSTDARSYEFGDATYRLDNKTDYGIELAVRGGSTLTVTETRGFSTDFAQPEAPEGLLSIDHGDLSVSIEVQAGASQSDEGNPVEVVGREGVAMSGLTVYGNTRQNLWVNPSGTNDGITVTANEDGSITISGTSELGTNIHSNKMYSLKPGGNYYISVDALPSGLRFGVSEYFSNGIFKTTKWLSETGTAITLDNDVESFTCVVTTDNASTVSGTYRVMLNEGSEAQPWCPPGIHGVEELTLGTAGKNLAAKFSSATQNGVTMTVGEDGVFDAKGNYSSYKASNIKYPTWFENGETYTASFDVDDAVSGLNAFLYFSWRKPGNVFYGSANVDIGESLTFTVPEDADSVYMCMYFGKSSDSYPVSVDLRGCRIQIERGTVATEYEPPNIAQTTIDLQGNALHSLPDGTRDELHVDSSGAVTLVKRVQEVTIDGDGSWSEFNTSYHGYMSNWSNFDAKPSGADAIDSAMCDTLIAGSYVYPNSICSSGGGGIAAYIKDPSFANNAAGVKSFFASNVTKFFMPLATEQTIELGSIEMPTYPYDTSYVSIASDIPTTLRVGYPVTSSLTVERQLPDGTRWTVGANLSDGEECIDPLPPLNLDYQYLVTASTEAGAAATTNVDARVESNAAAFNFGSDASTCELLRLDPSWSRSPSVATELYDFADGGEAGGLPMAYTTDSLAVSGQESATTLDEEQYRRLLAIARRYAVGWVRDQLGGRQYCALAWSFSGGVPRRLVECSVDMNEIRWREAW